MVARQDGQLQKGATEWSRQEDLNPLGNASDRFRKAMPNATSNRRDGHGEPGNLGCRRYTAVVDWARLSA